MTVKITRTSFRRRTCGARRGGFATRTNRGGFGAGADPGWRFAQRRRPKRRLRDLGCYNAEGADGVLDRTKGGRKPLLSEDQLVEFDWIVETKRLV